MKIFLSYASEQRALAKEIALALRAEQHAVFLDRSSLPAGEAYNAKIRQAIEDSRLFIFLISPDSVAEGRYTQTELEFVERKWPNPSRHVLPVMAISTPMSDIPAYLRAGTILDPQGNIAAEVVAAIPRDGWSRFLRRHGIPLFMLLAVIMLGAGAVWWREHVQNTRAALEQWFSEASIQQDAGHYEQAWQLIEQARSSAPDDAEVHRNEANLAMAWLDNARVSEGTGGFSAIVDQVLPALSRCSARPDQILAASCLAHMGWGDFLKLRDGRGGLDPQHSYQRALALDSGNTYAHAMLGFHVVASRGSLDDAKRHFERALAGGGARPYVRRLQLAAFLQYSDEALENEAIRVVNEMRLNAEPLPPEDRDDSLRWSRLWNIYYSRLLRGDQPQSFLAALPPADHLATFQWLFPEETVPDSRRGLYRFFLGSLQELAADYATALATFGALQKSFGKENPGGLLPDKTAEAVRRISKSSGAGKKSSK